MKHNLKLDWCARDAAKYAVEHWHYSKSLPSCDLVCVGVWENNKFIGVVVYSRGANPNLNKPYGLKKTGVCELARVALNEHLTPVTKIISISLKLLKKIAPGLKLVVSFADMNQKHTGKIYQAGNWIYTGIAKSTPQYFYKGKWIHQRQAGSLFGRTTNLNLKKRHILDKHRYLMPLDKETKEKLLYLSKPYPKSVSSSIEEHSSIQMKDGGSNPTLTHST